MGQDKKIIILITYFGKFPWYFSYFIHSCKYNPAFQFVIFSDIVKHLVLPSNVTIVYKTLEQVRLLAEMKIGVQVRIDFPYKLCDYKPAYGLIFEDYTGGYDFWGQSDLDIIFGNLESFITPRMLATYDFINLRHDYTTGCFTLSRNDITMNNFFRKSRDYKKVFFSEAYMGFDELNFKHCELSEGKELKDIGTDIECFTHVITNARDQKEINAYFDFILIEGIPGRITYDRGKLIYNHTYEAALYHLYWLKKIYHPRKAPKKIPDSYRISSRRIYKSTKPIVAGI